jgi:hypothetical protein
MTSKKISDKILSYNDRLFQGGIRKKFHMARFFWLRKKCLSLNDIKTDKVLELGCFDGRSIEYIHPKPVSYYGFDAGWEGGLKVAQEKYKNSTTYHFHQAYTSSDLKGKSTLAISLETLEHIPVELLDDYIKSLGDINNGYFLVTVPNEKGPIFL